MSYTMTVYVISTYVPKRRGAARQPSVRPHVFTDFDRAFQAFQHACGSNVSVDLKRDQSTVHEHWKTKVVTRLDAFAVPIPEQMPELLEVLKTARQYVATVHGQLAGAVGVNNAVAPDLAAIDRAIAKATGVSSDRE